MKYRILFFGCILTYSTALYSQSVKYSTAWFGPNAQPVQEFTQATIPSQTTISLMADGYFGYGDQTQNGYLKIEIPLLPQRVSMKLWTSLFEHYKVTDAVSLQRGMQQGLTGSANGDIYLQTRISLYKEKKNLPSIIFNYTLKTASGTGFLQRRYFDTPGYSVDLEVGKSFFTDLGSIDCIKTIADIGFLCWETSGSLQNDAPMYGFKCVVSDTSLWSFEQTLSGYYGWMHTNSHFSPDYGDAPLVYAARVNFFTDKMDYFLQYQQGIIDFPYRQIRAGIALQLAKLTPQYKENN